MQPGPHPDAINVRLVFRIYAWITMSSVVFIYMWPQRWLFGEWLSEMDLPGLPFGRYAVCSSNLGSRTALRRWSRRSNRDSWRWTISSRHRKARGRDGSGSGEIQRQARVLPRAWRMMASM